jgi:hypothetical protein
MPLLDLYEAFEKDLNGVLPVYEEIATTRSFNSSADFSTEHECLLEGVTSRVWQHWSKFCRHLLVESCTGTSTVAGLTIIGLPHATTDAHVSAAAINAVRGRPRVWYGTNTILRFEPTWGDVDKLSMVALALAPANSTAILGMCTMASRAAKMLQAIRNAAAHMNSQTVADVMRLSATYTTFSITHPCQALLWIDTASSWYLLPDAIDDLCSAATFAVI